MTDPVRVDGAAAAGDVLTQVFAVDVTAARSRCAACGTTAELGVHHLYADAPALVVRCPSCSAVVLRAGSREGRVLLDLSGSGLLEIPVPAPAG